MKKITLIVDDDPNILKTLSGPLSREGICIRRWKLLDRERTHFESS